MIDRGEAIGIAPGTAVYMDSKRVLID
jgi:hypothetical protein